MIQLIVDEHVQNNNSTILELHNYDEILYEHLVIPPLITAYISDLCIKKLTIPDNLKVIDIAPIRNIDMEFNIPKKLRTIILRDVNIINKSIMDLFPKDVSYRYVNCTLNGLPLNNLIKELYFKYFHKNPTYTSNYNINKGIIHNTIYYRYHNFIINEIYTYEKSILDAIKKNSIYKEELIEAVYHPTRVERGIHTYGMKFIDTL
jgi:hypothetical protein